MRTATVVWKDSQFSTICGYIGKACIFSIHYSGEQGGYVLHNHLPFVKKEIKGDDIKELKVLAPRILGHVIRKLRGIL